MADPVITDVKYSVMQANGDGAKTQWDFNFAGAEGTPGYISRDHVKCFLTSATGVITQVPITTGMWIGPNTIRVLPAVPVGTVITIYRDTPKDRPLVNFTTTAILNEQNLDRQARQSVYAAAEMVDRFLATKDSADIANANALLGLSQSTTALANAAAAVAAAAAATTASGTAVTTAQAANITAATALQTATTANQTANGIDGKATTALTNAAAAVVTANSASTAAGNANTVASGAASTAAGAVTTANTAKSTADTAKGTADTALADAATAKTSASAAVATANNAATTAGTAVTTANNASTKADTANSNASNAVTTANNAKTTADGIDAKATTALTNANAAVTTANNAATTANGIDTKATTALSNSVNATTTANTALNAANTKQAASDMYTTSISQQVGSTQPSWAVVPTVTGGTTPANRTGWYDLASSPHNLRLFFIPPPAPSNRGVNVVATVGFETQGTVTPDCTVFIRIVIRRASDNALLYTGPEAAMFIRQATPWWHGSVTASFGVVGLPAGVQLRASVEVVKGNNVTGSDPNVYAKAGSMTILTF